MYRAVLDTCALVLGRQRDFLLQLATENAYAPLWSTGILDELDYVLARLDVKRGRPDSDVRRERLFAQMTEAFPGAAIEAPNDPAPTTTRRPHARPPSTSQCGIDRNHS